MGKIVITKLRDTDMLFLFDGNHELMHIKCINASIVGNIYMGKITEINRAMNCAFALIAKKTKVFLPLSEIPGGQIKCGDELPIRITADAIKTKRPQGSAYLNLAGEYCVMHLDGHGINISKKLPEYTANRLITILREQKEIDLTPFRWMIRTNSASLLEGEEDLSPLYDEIRRFSRIGEFLRNEAQSRTLYTVLYEGSAGAGGVIRDIPSEDYDDIITDNPEVYDTLTTLDLCRNKRLRLYTEEGVSLKNLYNLETHLGRLLDKKVYLHSGGYLVIEQTEAMNVIDVNSGKTDGRRRDSANFIRKVNTEAAIEVARQLKLRNLSGIIMVDFINMKDREEEKALLELLGAELKKDRVATNLVDMTPLGIVEITRRKVDLSLAEEFSFS
ncbi:MAG: ribonuclease E/G [Lachnospiraceae bacterium]|nr:ribonuclease E/G [Lachnospiraceae bacterium]